MWAPRRAGPEPQWPTYGMNDVSVRAAMQNTFCMVLLLLFEEFHAPLNVMRARRSFSPTRSVPSLSSAHEHFALS